ncbi:TIGR01777 family protein [Mycolicibacter virginiensis]|uniref:TIGR01777 family protein n=1 Tax=Mycolicibacter virginiensis TaxID=1795032 RepID=A0A9X7IRA4_9MYCO|nr:TIGR01777 family oxidoreductase [Mycolicibacter virginiensis]PQM53970.1 TIGR01777 family protein [Mycolicibacter virginiensis]
MGLVYSSEIEAPRLSPPWQAMRLRREAESLRDGTAELALPGGLRWVAEHQASGYDPPRQFADELGSRGLASLPARLVMKWQHIHEFDELGDGRTLMTDRVDTTVPGALLRPMFVYRHRQLADDLAAHQRAKAHGLQPLTVAVSGASGLVGSALTAFLSTGGHRVIRLVRRTAGNPDDRQWNPDDPARDLLAGVDAVVHLAGASIAGRFTAEHRRVIRDSRIGPTRKLAELVAETGPTALICASAVGYYGYDRGDDVLTEDSQRGDGYLAEVVADWEDALAPAEQSGARVVRVRTGIVQSPRGGTLRLMRPLFAAGLGGRLGSGRQWLSWIGIDDLIDVYHRALWDTGLSGPVNAVAPQPVRNSDYTKALGRVLRRPTILPVPGLGPRLLLGAQGARELACASQRVLPARLGEAGHRFRAPELEPLLRHLLGRAGSATC